MQSTKCSCSRFRGCGRNGKNNIQTTGKAIQLRLHGIRFLSEHLDLLEHRATTSAGKPVSILRVKAEKIFALPSAFLVVCSCSLFSTCLDCFMIFAPNRHECVTVVIKCFCPISLCFILSCLDILKWKGFLIKPTVCSILMIDVTIDERN